MSDKMSDSRDSPIGGSLNEKFTFTSNFTSKPAPTLFGDISEHRVTFCIDTSGSMYHCLDAVKDHLIETLQHFANRPSSDDNPDLFNLLEFSTDVTMWADKMVRCTPETVAVATDWIRQLNPKTGTNTMDALLTALGDSSCDAVYLVTDSVPDRKASDVIDQAVLAAGNRPVHCFYVQGGLPDSSAMEFLKELAMETYGSLHVVTIANHGAIERITPIYRAEMSAERIVRTTDGNIYPSNHKLCSVSATLNGIAYPPPVPIVYPPPFPVAKTFSYPYALAIPPHPYCLYPWPYRYYHYYAQPVGGAAVGWSRYRPAAAWLRHAQEFISGMTVMTPSAGALLMNMRVLARRHADGFFYRGMSKSQILGNKFLVELSPCKHGRFRDTEYQETFVHDIVSHSDALRHPVLVDDKVLAPWEPEGERYAPGVVIDGQEKRIAEGGGPDTPLVVTFWDGKTVNIDPGRALWIPSDFHDRISFELKLPKNVRLEFAQRDCYPQMTMPGYPSSGPVAYPLEFDRYTPPGWIPSNSAISLNTPYGVSRVWEPSPFYRLDRRNESPFATTSAEVEKAIPGTDITAEELSRKVSAQISSNKKLLSEHRKEAEEKEREEREREEKEREASTREVKETKDHPCECTLSKSVSFDSGRRRELKDIPCQCSRSDVSDYEFDDTSDVEESDVKRRSAKLLHRRKNQRKTAENRRWRYWGNEPAPSVHEPMHHGPYRLGEYRDSVGLPNFALRDRARSASPDKVSATVRDCMYQSQSSSFIWPQPKPPKQAPGRDMSELLGLYQRPQELVAEARRDYRQSRVLEREIGWQKRAVDQELTNQKYQDYRRYQTSLQINRGVQRHLAEAQREQDRLMTKRLNHAQQDYERLSALSADNSKYGRHIAAMGQRREERILRSAQAEHQANMVNAQRQAVKELESVKRTEQHAASVVEADRQSAQAQVARQRQVKQQESCYKQKENDAQKRKELIRQVQEQNMAIYRSQVLP